MEGGDSQAEENNKVKVDELPEEKQKQLIKSWVKTLKSASATVASKSKEREPFKNVYAGIDIASALVKEIQNCRKCDDLTKVEKIWMDFALIHVYSCLSKWKELCEELSSAAQYHNLCIELIEKVLHEEDNASDAKHESSEVSIGIERCKYMLIYELTRSAILCSLRDYPTEALKLLQRAEKYYHDEVPDECKDQNRKPKATDQESNILAINSLNRESFSDMFNYLLYYLGQAYRIDDQKDKAILYLYEVLKRQLHSKEQSKISWADDCSKMASVLTSNVQAFETAGRVLLAATAVLESVPDDEKQSSQFKHGKVEIGRVWVKFGVELLEFSADRLRDLEDQNHKSYRHRNIKLESHELKSLGIKGDIQEYDLMYLISNLDFPTVDTSKVVRQEFRGKFVRDYEEGREVFLGVQKWVNICKDYYTFNEHATDYVEIMTDYSNAFKYLSKFEPYLERQIKMHRRRATIIGDMLDQLNPKIYYDICHYLLGDMADIYEKIYKLKVCEIKENGGSMVHKDKKLVKWLSDAVKANCRNLENFGIDINDPDPSKDFESDHEKSLLRCVLSTARILGNIAHDHPLHPDVGSMTDDAKKYYQFFLKYLDSRPSLKAEFKTLYDTSVEIPELLEMQRRKIQWMISNLQLSNT